jgi:hypothetical protein
LIALQKNSAGNGDMGLGFRASFKGAEFITNFTKSVAAIKPVWVRVSALRPKCIKRAKTASLFLLEAIGS